MIFKVDDLLEDIQKELPIKVPKWLIKIVCNKAIRTIARIITEEKGSLLLYKNEIHTIYYEPDVKAICGQLADLNETEFLDKPKTVIDGEEKGIHITLRGSRGVERVYVGRHNIYSKNSRKHAKRKARKIH